jgi:hypothetical protein
MTPQAGYFGCVLVHFFTCLRWPILPAAETPLDAPQKPWHTTFFPAIQHSRHPFEKNQTVMSLWSFTEHDGSESSTSRYKIKNITAKRTLSFGLDLTSSP